VDGMARILNQPVCDSCQDHFHVCD
jgi:hypothetical protein